jgi:aspartate racemase
MKLLGIIGGLGPESTIEFYKEVIRVYRERVPDSSQPEFLINSVNMKIVVDAVTVDDLATIADYLVEQIERLADAGADFAIISANTPHLVFDEVCRRSTIPLISIVEAAAQATKTKGLQRVGLMGTCFTMKARLFPDAFARHEIQIAVPSDAEQQLIHDIYMNELVNGIVRDESRQRLLSIAQRMKREDRIEGLLLGGTELSLIIKSIDGTGLELLDTMKIQVEAAINEMLS